MKPLQRVFTKHATPQVASMVPLESGDILIKQNNTHIRNRHIYPVQKGKSWFWAKFHETFAESVLETGNSTLGEHGVVGVVVYPQ